MSDWYVNSATGNDSTGTGSSGSPFATIQKGLDSHAAAGDRVIVQVGSGYTLTASLTMSSNGSTVGFNLPNVLMGCTTTPGDGGRPVLTLSGSSLTAVALSSVGWWVERFEIDCASQTSSTGVSAAAWSIYHDLKIHHFTLRGADLSAQHQQIFDCDFYDGTSAATAAIELRNPGGAVIVNNDVRDNACPGIVADAAAAILGNRVHNNTGASSDGISFSYASTVDGNVAWGNGRDGIRCPTFVLSQLVRNNIVGANGGFNLRYTGAQTMPATGAFDYNAFYPSTGGDRSKFTAGAHDVTLSADPFTDAASGDFSLNNAAGGGAACRAAGIPGPTPRGTTTGYRDLGATQHQDSGGGGGISLGRLKSKLAMAGVL